MTIDLSQIITNLQSDVNAADSDTSMRDILSLLHRGKKVTELHKWYDSAGVLPIDSAYNGYMAFTKSDNTMRVFNDSDLRWAELDSALEATAEASVRQASNYGFMGGGTMPSIAPAWDYIQKFSLTVDGNSTDVGNLIDRITGLHGASSATHGYMMGGFIGHGPNSPAVTNAIQKFSHTVDGDATDVADLLSTIRSGGGAYSPTHGYQFGGDPGPTNQIQKFEFATDGNSTDVANLTAPTRYNSGIAISSTHIYSMGGYPGTTPTGDYVETIEKFPFTADGDATDAGDLSAGVAYHSGNQSTTHGYRAGGNGAVPAPGSRNEIEKFEFATDGNAADVGDLTLARYPLGNGVSSTTHGYTMGGYGGGYSNIIDKYSFVSGGNAVDVGDTLAALNGYGSSQN